jgi:nucleotide-binding universal stress UspA family protein
MYQRILLAYDGSREGRMALREGALLAKACNAEVFLLSVDIAASIVKYSEGACANAMDQHQEMVREIFNEGVDRLKALGLTPVSRIAEGSDPTELIRAFAEEIAADLVVVGHRRQSLLERWWSGPSGGYLSDRLKCSLLIARNSP